MRGVPIGKVVNVALVGCSDYQVVKAQRHVDDSVLKVQELAHFSQNISNDDSVLVVKICLPIVVAELFVDHLSKNYVTASA